MNYGILFYIWLTLEGKGFLSNFCNFLGFRELKEVEKHGPETL